MLVCPQTLPGGRPRRDLPQLDLHEYFSSPVECASGLASNWRGERTRWIHSRDVAGMLQGCGRDGTLTGAHELLGTKWTPELANYV